MSGNIFVDIINVEKVSNVSLNDTKVIRKSVPSTIQNNASDKEDMKALVHFLQFHSMDA